MRYLVLSLMVAVLFGCSSSTPYQKMRASGGYDDIRMGTDTFRVRSEVNGFSDATRADDIVLLRAAEVSCLNKYRYFEIVDRSADLDGKFKSIALTVKLKKTPTDYDAKAIIESLTRKLSVKKTCSFK